MADSTLEGRDSTLGSYTDPSNLNPLQPAPIELQKMFKRYKNDCRADFNGDNGDLLEATRLDANIVLKAFQDFLSSGNKTSLAPALPLDSNDIDHGRVYCSKKIKGLYFLPNLFNVDVQSKLIACLLHRDLSNPKHKTNLHAHYNIPYPGENQSLFKASSATDFTPKDPSQHKPLSMKRALDRKLRWMTLGGQYDWTAKVYPEEQPPPFPSDIAALVKSLFPSMDPQAAIINVYHPHDTLSLHRDVAEKTDRGLVSISLGLDCLFMVGIEDNVTGEIKSQILRLRSGDAILMSQEARFAWHAVPSIIPFTCPSQLEQWPGPEFPEWKGWMKDKRINFNIRQMYEA